MLQEFDFFFLNIGTDIDAISESLSPKVIAYPFFKIFLYLSFLNYYKLTRYVPLEPLFKVFYLQFNLSV